MEKEYCPHCGKENKKGSIYCRNCGNRLSAIGINDSKSFLSENKSKLLIGTIIALLVVIVLVGTYAIVTSNKAPEKNNVANSSFVGESSGPSPATETPVRETQSTWHKIGSYSGVGDKQITMTSNGSNIKVVSSAMPIKNYADNYMYTTVYENSNSIGSSSLSWNSKSAVAEKEDNIQFSSVNGYTYTIDVSAYELQYWNVDIYAYY